jgi:hypothetical protein
MKPSEHTAQVLLEQEAIAAACRRRIEQAHRFTGWASSDMKAAALSDYGQRQLKAEAWIRLLNARLELERAQEAITDYYTDKVQRGQPQGNPR